MKTIKVLLSKYNDRASRFVYFCSGLRGYTHASLALEDYPDEFFSFNRRGFIIETPEKCRRHGVQSCRMYEMEVSDEVYEKIHSQIETMRSNRKDYHYSVVTMLAALLRIPYQRKQHYVCSTFVADILHNSGALQLRRAPSITIPNDFPQLMSAVSQLKSIISTPF